jgi:hypothetical protein
MRQRTKEESKERAILQEEATLNLTQLTLYWKNVDLFMRLRRPNDEIKNLLAACFQAL